MYTKQWGKMYCMDLSSFTISLADVTLSCSNKNDHQNLKSGFFYQNLIILLASPALTSCHDIMHHDSWRLLLLNLAVLMTDRPIVLTIMPCQQLQNTLLGAATATTTTIYYYYYY